MNERGEFTPGPWAYEQDDFGDGDGPQFIIRADKYEEGEAGSGLVAAVFSTDDVDVRADNNLSDRAEATARLIAAAPDLLAALQDLLEFNEVSCDDRFCSKHSEHRQAVDRSYAAIAKALGTSP